MKTRRDFIKVFTASFTCFPLFKNVCTKETVNPEYSEAKYQNAIYVKSPYTSAQRFGCVAEVEKALQRFYQEHPNGKNSKGELDALVIDDMEAFSNAICCNKNERVITIHGYRVGDYGKNKEGKAPVLRVVEIKEKHE